MNLIMKVNNENLLDVFRWIDRSSFPHADEIMTKKIKRDHTLGTFCSDFPMYVIEDGEEILYLARGNDNKFLDNISEATLQTQEQGCYLLSNRDDIESVIKSDTTLRLRLADLELGMITKRKDLWLPEYGCFYISPFYKKLTSSQRMIAERICGGEERLKETAHMLLRPPKLGYDTIHVELLTQGYVREKLRENSSYAISHAYLLINSRSISLELPHGIWMQDHHYLLYKILESAVNTKEDIFLSVLQNAEKYISEHSISGFSGALMDTLNKYENK